MIVLIDRQALSEIMITEELCRSVPPIGVEICLSDK